MSQKQFAEAVDLPTKPIVYEIMKEDWALKSSVTCAKLAFIKEHEKQKLRVSDWLLENLFPALRDLESFCENFLLSSERI